MIFKTYWEATWFFILLLGAVIVIGMLIYTMVNNEVSDIRDRKHAMSREDGPSPTTPDIRRSQSSAELRATGVVTTNFPIGIHDAAAFKDGLVLAASIGPHGSTLMRSDRQGETQVVDCGYGPHSFSNYNGTPIVYICKMKQPTACLELESYAPGESVLFESVSTQKIDSVPYNGTHALASWGGRVAVSFGCVIYVYRNSVHSRKMVSIQHPISPRNIPSITGMYMTGMYLVAWTRIVSGHAVFKVYEWIGVKYRELSHQVKVPGSIEQFSIEDDTPHTARFKLSDGMAYLLVLDKGVVQRTPDRDDDRTFLPSGSRVYHNGRIETRSGSTLCEASKCDKYTMHTSGCIVSFIDGSKDVSVFTE